MNTVLDVILAACNVAVVSFVDFVGGLIVSLVYLVFCHWLVWLMCVVLFWSTL